MVGIGIVGLGFMGMTHYHALGRVRGARVAAICTRDARKRAGDWRGIRGNFGPRGGRVDLSRVRTYSRIELLLDDETIDLVDIQPTEGITISDLERRLGDYTPGRWAWPTEPAG